MHTAFHRFTNNTQKRYRSLVFFFVNWGIGGVFLLRGKYRCSRERLKIIELFTGAQECDSLLSINEDYMGSSRISGKGVHMKKGVEVRFADFISFFLNTPRK